MRRCAGRGVRGRQGGRLRLRHLRRQARRRAHGRRLQQRRHRPLVRRAAAPAAPSRAVARAGHHRRTPTMLGERICAGRRAARGHRQPDRRPAPALLRLCTPARGDGACAGAAVVPRGQRARAVRRDAAHAQRLRSATHQPAQPRSDPRLCAGVHGGATARAAPAERMRGMRRTNGLHARNAAGAAALTFNAKVPGLRGGTHGHVRRRLCQPRGRDPRQELVQHGKASVLRSRRRC